MIVDRIDRWIGPNWNPKSLSSGIVVYPWRMIDAKPKHVFMSQICFYFVTFGFIIRSANYYRAVVVIHSEFAYNASLHPLSASQSGNKFVWSGSHWNLIWFYSCQVKFVNRFCISIANSVIPFTCWVFHSILQCRVSSLNCLSSFGRRCCILGVGGRGFNALKVLPRQSQNDYRWLATWWSIK